MEEDEWIKLIKFTIKKMGLGHRFNELVDLGYIGYSKALNNYDPKMSAFTTYAVKCIQNEIGSYYRKLNSLSRKGMFNEVSLNSLMDDKYELINSIPDDYSLEDEIEKKDLVDIIIKVAKDNLNEKEYLLFDLYYLKNYKQCEILKKYKYNNISRVIIRINRKIKNDSRIKRINKELNYV